MELETIGENAGKVWRTLNEMRGEISIQELSRKINLSAEDVALAVGWLARENNIFIQRHNYLLYVSHYLKKIDCLGLKNIMGRIVKQYAPLCFYDLEQVCAPVFIKSLSVRK
mgnify:FL=1